LDLRLGALFPKLPERETHSLCLYIPIHYETSRFFLLGFKHCLVFESRFVIRIYLSGVLTKPGFGFFVDLSNVS